ncbi:hypothetical protein ES703_15108 [subsurface metagenome]
MYYDIPITIPPNTLEVTPVRVELKLTHGVITRVIVRPRPGHASLAHLRVIYQGHQIYPANRDSDLHGDTFPMEWEEYIELLSAPYTLILEGWNDDDTYPHTFDFGVALIERKFTLTYVMLKAVSQLAGIFSPRRLFTGGK